MPSVVPSAPAPTAAAAPRPEDPGIKPLGDPQRQQSSNGELGNDAVSLLRIIVLFFHSPSGRKCDTTCRLVHALLLSA